MNIFKALNQLLELLIDIKQDMKVIHNIEYSTAYIKLNKVITAIDSILKYKNKPVKKIAIVSNMNRKNKLGKVKDLLGDKI